MRQKCTDQRVEYNALILMQTTSHVQLKLLKVDNDCMTHLPERPLALLRDKIWFHSQIQPQLPAKKILRRFLALVQTQSLVPALLQELALLHVQPSPFHVCPVVCLGRSHLKSEEVGVTIKVS